MGKKKIVLLGATGTVGRKAFDLITQNEHYELKAIMGNTNWELLLQQAISSSPKYVLLYDFGSYKRFEEAAGNGNIRGRFKVLFGEEGLQHILSSDEVDVVFIAVSGSVGLKMCVSALEEKKDIILANKEAIVMAGEIIMDLAKKNNCKVIPVDSEHSGIFQLLQGNEKSMIRRIILTASGGPCYLQKKEDFGKITREFALNHPVWKMGKRITIDSATLMNKALEIIEAKWLFNIEPDRIKVIIHPQSIIHSMIEFEDGVIFAQMSPPDMNFPIQYALNYPIRKRNENLKPLDFGALHELTFLEPDIEKFPSLSYGYKAAREGGTLPVVLNSADEVAVELFLQGRIKFNQITEIIGCVMDLHKNMANPSLEDIFKVDQWARQEAIRLSDLFISKEL